MAAQKENKQGFNELIDSLKLNTLQNAFMKQRWLSQQQWMSAKSNQARNRYYIIKLIIVISSTLLPALISFDFGIENARTVKLITLGLSLAIAISAGLEEFFNFGERWRHYRSTSELLKAEGWRYFSLTEHYQNIKSHDQAISEI